MLTLGILCSGGLGLNTLEKISREYSIKFILTDKNSNEIIDFANDYHIPIYSGNPRKGKGYNFINKLKVDVIASINYLFLVEQDIINHSKLMTFNIHGSLLPKYRGRTPHVWAIINGETKTGITAHLIDENCDTGKIIHQIEVPIETNDTGAMILDKYAQLYYPLVKEVLNDIESDKLNFTNQDENGATYFGKRTPTDGEIDWNWKKERIRNWIRAQAAPYPGAFSFYNYEKVIIDRISFSDENTQPTQNNGEIIKIAPQLIVKTVNGAISLDSIRSKNCNFMVGNKFENENRE